jgi:hypothetical protein
MKQPRIRAALVVVGPALIVSTLAWACPMEPDAAARTAASGDALLTIQVAFPLHQPSGADANAMLPRQPTGAAIPLVMDSAAALSPLAHPATFLDFDFAARR